ncbi:uncharacterized protein LOC144172895 [Haemaphysalis longicornis]
MEDMSYDDLLAAARARGWKGKGNPKKESLLAFIRRTPAPAAFSEPRVGERSGESGQEEPAKGTQKAKRPRESKVKKVPNFQGLHERFFQSMPSISDRATPKPRKTARTHGVCSVQASATRPGRGGTSKRERQAASSLARRSGATGIQPGPSGVGQEEPAKGTQKAKRPRESKVKKVPSFQGLHERLFQSMPSISDCATPKHKTARAHGVCSVQASATRPGRCGTSKRERQAASSLARRSWVTGIQPGPSGGGQEAAVEDKNTGSGDNAGPRVKAAKQRDTATAVAPSVRPPRKSAPADRTRREEKRKDK